MTEKILKESFKATTPIGQKKYAGKDPGIYLDQCCGMRIHKILVRIRIHWGIDPDADSDHAIFVSKGTFTSFFKNKMSLRS